MSPTDQATPQQGSRRTWLVVGALALIVLGTFWSRLSEPGADNLYVQLANAMLHGRIDIPQRMHDVVVVGDRIYVPFPPFPAVLLIPFVWILGVEAPSPVLVSIGLTWVGAIALRASLRRLALPRDSIPWLLGAFFLGTAYWMCAVWSKGVSFFAHVVASVCLLLAIAEAFGRGRGAWVGLWLGLAFLSRQMTLYAFVFLAAVLWRRDAVTTRRRWVDACSFAAVFGACVLVYLWYNWLRFGDPFDTGYGLLELAGHQRERVARYGLFHPIYLPFNLVNYLLQGFHVRFSPPTYLWPGPIEMDPFGTSLTFASPFLFIAFWARWDRTLLVAAWASIAAAFVHMLFYFNNGWVQPQSHRFALDFIPVLMLLVALGTLRVPTLVWQAAVAYSVAVSAVALFLIPLLNKLAKLF